jgi:hypothetical protein
MPAICFLIECASGAHVAISLSPALTVMLALLIRKTYNKTKPNKTKHSKANNIKQNKT